jgi:hypothetical protein
VRTVLNDSDTICFITLMEGKYPQQRKLRLID